MKKYAHSIAARDKVVECYFAATSVILVFTATLKLISVVAAPKMLLKPDVLFLLSRKHVLLGVAVAEIVIGLYLLLGAQAWKRGLALLWLCGCFLVYRLALWFLDPHMSCGCLGVYFPLLQLKQQTLDVLALVLLGYFLLGSVLVLINALSQSTSD